MKPDLKKVLELLITEEQDQASEMLHEWFISKSRTILEELMHEDDDVLDDIKKDKEEIESEEYYGDGDLSEDEDEDEAEFETSDEDETDSDVENLEAELDAHEEEDADLGSKVDDLSMQLADLRAEFDEIMGGVASDNDDEAESDFDFDDLDDDADLDAGDPDDEGDNDSDSEIESEYTNLGEAFDLELVADPALSGDKEIGNGGKIKVSSHSPLPNVDAAKRFGGDFVEIKGTTHEGYDLEDAPEVETQGLLKNQVKNSKQGLEAVKSVGNGSLLNKEPAADKGKSPIGGGAADLRGTDTKRK